jgi:hypothetical protein
VRGTKGAIVWPSRLKENLATITISDGSVDLIAPRAHSLLWEAGSEGARRVARFFAANPNCVRLLGPAQIDLGVRLALRQYREG